MVHGHLDAEFFGNADRSQNVVGPVCMALQRDLALDDRDHGLQLHVKAGIFAGFLVLKVPSGLEQQLAKQSSGSHTGGGALLHALAVAALGVLAEGGLHGNGVLNDHLIHPLAGELDGSKGAAHHVSAAGTGAGGGNTPPDGQGEGLVLGIDGVDGPQVGSQGIDDFIVIPAFPAHGLVVQTDVAMGIHTARGHQTALGINDLGFGCIDDGGDLQNFAVVTDEDAAVFQVGACHSLDMSVFDQKHSKSLLFLFLPL